MLSKRINTKNQVIVIIGGGLAGLCTGAYLVRDGFTVIIFEQSAQTGGYFRSFVRNGFKFDAGLKAVENAGILIPMLKQLGLEKSVNLEKSNTALVLPDQFIKLSESKDIIRFIHALGEHFTDQKKGLRLLLRQIERIGAWINLLETAPNPLFLSNKQILSALFKWIISNFPALIYFRRTYGLLNVPMERFLKDYIDNPALINLLSELFFEGTPALFGLGYSRVFLDYYYPQDGMQTLTETLTEYIKERGGTIKTNTRISRILVSNNQATGVELEDGNQVGADYVVSASDMKKTYLEMLRPGDLPPEYRNKLLKAHIGESAFCVFLGIDIDPESLPVQGCSHLYYLPDYEGTNAKESMNVDYFKRTPLEISIPCINNRGLAPPGKSGIIISALAKYEFAGNWGIKNGKTTAEYYYLKEQIADQFVNNAARAIPGLKDHILFREVATPYTYYRYTLNSNGSICGWTYDRQKTFNPVGIGRIQKAVLTPVERLLQAGHWTVYPGGAPVSILSGRVAADYIMRNHGK